jgi:hypothetical protein
MAMRFDRSFELHQRRAEAPVDVDNVPGYNT